MAQSGPIPIPKRKSTETTPSSPPSLFSALFGVLADVAVTVTTGSPPENSFIVRSGGGGTQPQQQPPSPSRLRSTWGAFTPRQDDDDDVDPDPTMDLISTEDTEVEEEPIASVILPHTFGDRFPMRVFHQGERQWSAVDSERKYSDEEIRAFQQSISLKLNDSGDAENIIAGLRRHPGSRPGREAWLNNYILNNLFRIIAEKSGGRIFCLGSNYFSDLQLQINGLSYERGTTPHAIQQALLAADLIVLPVHQQLPLEHWNFAFLKRTSARHYKIGVLDGFNNDLGYHQIIHAKMREYLQIMHGQDFTCEYISIPIPRQMDETECGTVGLFYLEKIAQGDDLSEYIRIAGLLCDYSQGRYRALELFHENQLNPRRQVTPGFSMRQQPSATWSAAGTGPLERQSSEGQSVQKIYQSRIVTKMGGKI